MQLTLIAPAHTKQAKPVLAVEKVPQNIALGDRCFITVSQGDRSWFYPLQLTEVEGHWLLPRLERFDWSLETGVPADLPKISAVIEREIDDRLVKGGAK